MRCVVLQPSYIPWRGYFHQIQLADTFVFYDDAQYDARGWRNRNRVKAPGGTRWLTIPVLHRGSQQQRTPIDQVEICWDRDWARRHWTTLEHLYGNAPYFEEYRPLLEPFYARRAQRLAEFTIDLTVALALALGIGETRYLRSSRIDRPRANKSDDLIALLQQVGAEDYLTGPSARNYLDEPAFERAGISVSYMSYDYPPYEQLHPPYDPRVSILDLLFMCGPSAPQRIWNPPGEPS